MKSMPRILPLVGVAIGGVLVVNAISGARDLPSLVSGARAFAEEAARGDQDKSAKPGSGAPAAAGAGLPAASIAPKPVCAPTAAELAKAAGLSPAELQVLQSLGQRRGQLDAREADLSTQIALLAAAEAKLDAKLKALEGLKGEVRNLLHETDAKEQAEIDRLVKVFEGMKAKDAAPRLVTLDDSVRIPIAARMKERSLAAIVAAMPPADAKKLTEALARRFSDAKAAAEKAASAEQAATPAAAEPVKQAAAPKSPAPKKAAPRKTAPPVAQAKAPAPQTPATPAAPVPYSPEKPAAVPPETTG